MRIQRARLARLLAAGWLAGVCLVGVWLPAAGLTPQAAQAQPARRDPGGGLRAEEIERWRQQLDAARVQLEAALRRSDAAQAAYRNWRQRRYPRGEARAKLLAELQDSTQALEDARAALPRLREAARRDGAPPGLLRSFADEGD